MDKLNPMREREQIVIGAIRYTYVWCLAPPGTPWVKILSCKSG